MLDTLRAEDLSTLTGKPCRISIGGDCFLTLAVQSVEERTRLKRPQDTRAPFSVLLKGPLEPSFMSGVFDVEWEGGLSLNGVCIARVMPPWGEDMDSAYYQMVFN